MHTLKHFYIHYLYSKLKCIINDISNRLTKGVSKMLRQQMIKIHLYAHCNDLFLLKLNQKLNFDTSPLPCLFAPMYVHTYVTYICMHMYEYLPQNMFLLCALLWYCRLPRCQCHSDVGPVMFVCSPYIARDVSKCVCVSVRFALS